MASWSENSSYQGAASGAAVGTMINPGMGTAIGAGVGFVAGGLLGGSQQDAARKAEEERQKEIQRAIDRQNTKDFHAKAAAESWAIADIGINKEDQVLDARDNMSGLQNDATKNHATEDRLSKKIAQIGGLSNDGIEGMYKRSVGNKYKNRLKDATFNAQVSDSTLAANKGIIDSYDAGINAPKKY